MKLKNLGGGRGLYGLPPFKSRNHGELRVQDSSAATALPCVWIYAEIGYSNPEVPPTMHLHFHDAVKLRDRLSAWIRARRTR